jgi:hypothetical protein
VGGVVGSGSGGAVVEGTGSAVVGGAVVGCGALVVGAIVGPPVSVVGRAVTFGTGEITKFQTPTPKVVSRATAAAAIETTTPVLD